MWRRLASIGLVVAGSLGASPAPASADVVSEQIDAAHTGVSAQALAPPLRERWRRTFDPDVPIDHEVRWPLIADGRVFVTFHDRDGGPAQLFALDPATGATLWERDVAGRLAYDSGRVLAMTSDTLYAFDAATGAEVWSRSTWPGRDGSAWRSGPVAAGGVAYVGVIGYGTGVYAVNVADGSVKWHREVNAGIGIGVSGDRVYVNDGNALLALRSSDGGDVWRSPAPRDAYFFDVDPAIAGGRVYVASRYDGAVYDAASGALLRQRLWMDPMAAVDAQRAYVLSGVSAEPEAVLQAVDVATGATAWEFGGWDGVTSYPLVSGDQVYVTAKRGVLYALDRSTGAVTWCTRTNTVNYGNDAHTLAVGDGLLLLAVGGELVALEQGGTPGCRFYETALPGYGEPIDGASTVAAGSPGGFVAADGGFVARSQAQSVLVDAAGPTLTTPTASVQLRVRGARRPRVVPEARLPGVVNDYTGRHGSRVGLRRYGRIRLRDVRRGVDMVVRGSTDGRFAYDLAVRPGADPRNVVLDFEGARRPSLDRDGALVLRTPAGPLRQPPPVAYQRVGGRPRGVAVRFRITGNGGVGFAVGRYDRSRPLVIDPTLEWSSYLGGGVDDEANAIASDAAGNVYVAGRTMSRDLAAHGWDERNAICEDDPPCWDAFVSKYDPRGAPVHVTYLSGRRDDVALAVAADAAGNAYVTGYTTSPDFPVRSAFQPEWRCGSPYGDAFVTKLSPDGTALAYSSYLGGCGTFGDVARGIAVDGQGRAVVAGETDAFDFPTTAGAADRVCAQPGGFCRDAFVARVAPSGSTLEWSTLFGGDESDEIPYDVELDAQGRPVIVGETAGWGTKDFPATPGAYDTDPATSFSEVFAARLAADGSAVQWATAFGGIDWDTGYDAALDRDGNVHIAGTTESRDFPTTPGAYDRVCDEVADEYSCTNQPDAFALELSADGSRLLASTYVGGAGYDHGLGIAVDSAGRSYVAGGSSSPRGFPLVDAFRSQPTYDWCGVLADCDDAFLVRLDASLSHVEYGTFHGGRSQDIARGVTLADGDAWIAGATYSSDVATTAGAPQPRWAGGNCSFLRQWFEFTPCSDAFLARIDEARPPAPTPAPSATPWPTATAFPPPGTTGTSGGAATSTGSGGTQARRRVARRLAVRVHVRRLTGRVRAAASACSRRVPVLLERRRPGTWRRVVRVRTGRHGRFAMRLPASGHLRVHAPRILRPGLRCADVRRRLPA